MTQMSMTSPVFSKPATLVGHRGMGKGLVHGHVENTLDSFLAALRAGSDWVEVDVRRTLDDELFVAHDAAFPDGTFLTEVTGAQASRYGALRIEELLEALPPEAGVAFDIKSSMEDAARSGPETTAGLLGAVAKPWLGYRALLGLSFDPSALQHLRDEVPGMALGWTTWLRFPIGHAVAAAAHLDVQLLAVHAGSLWPNASTAPADIPDLRDVVTRVHESNRQLMAWCPTQDQTRSLAAAEVDALVVDDVPAHARMIPTSKMAAR